MLYAGFGTILLDSSMAIAFSTDTLVENVAELLG